MPLLSALRRFSPIAAPQLIQLPAEELTWAKVKVPSIRVPDLASPEVAEDLTALDFEVVIENELMPPDVFSVDDDPSTDFQIIDLLDPLGPPSSHGSIYVKKQEEVRLKGETRTKTRIEPLGLKQRFDAKKPKGLDIFELLLPLLMPPAVTDFRDELLFPAELYPFQRAGVKWLFENESALLADDMGLGKTVQSITAFRALIRRSLALQALVVCPKSILGNWMRELERWAPELVAIRIQGNQQTRKLAWHAYVGKCHVLLATYESIRQDQEFIKGRMFDLLVADEAQRVKNRSAGVSRALRAVPARRRWALTGTPLENKVDDLGTILDLVRPGLFPVADVGRLSPKQVRERARPYMLRRRKEEALPELPEKVIDTKWIELSEAQRKAYDKAEGQGVDDLKARSGVTVQHVFALIQQLKQICNFDPDTKESAKLEFLKEDFLEEACRDDGKVLIFSQYVGALEEIEKRLGEYDPLLYTGQLSSSKRSQVEELFSARDEHKVLLLSLRAGGVGLNLERANYVVHFDRWWNPAVERQAEGRADRIGQTKTVFVARLICQDTIEERIDRLLEGKKILFQEVVDELADVNLERLLSEEELFDLFGLTAPRRGVRGFAVTKTTVPAESDEALSEAEATSRQAKEKEIITDAKRLAGGIRRMREVRRAEPIRPEEPFSNLVRLRQILRECENYIWWADRYFTERGLEELVAGLDPAIVNQVRILSGPDNVTDRTRSDFARFRAEVERKGVGAEWRILKGFAHDRFIVSANTCFNVPSIDTVLRGMHSEILETPNRPPFETWWAQAEPI